MHYSIKLSDSETVSIAMPKGLDAQTAMILGAIASHINPDISAIVEEMGEEMLGVICYCLLEGQKSLDAPEVGQLIKMFSSDVTSLTLGGLEAVLDVYENARKQEATKTEAIYTATAESEESMDEA